MVTSNPQSWGPKELQWLLSGYRTALNGPKLAPLGPKWAKTGPKAAPGHAQILVPNAHWVQYASCDKQRANGTQKTKVDGPG